jgi:hypothetical protein
LIIHRTSPYRLGCDVRLRYHRDGPPRGSAGLIFLN